MPFTWDSHETSNQLLEVEIEGIYREYNIDIIKEHEPIVFKDNQLMQNNEIE